MGIKKRGERGASPLSRLGFGFGDEKKEFGFPGYPSLAPVVGKALIAAVVAP